MYLALIDFQNYFWSLRNTKQSGYLAAVLAAWCSKLFALCAFTVLTVAFLATVVQLLNILISLISHSKFPTSCSW
jgi:hypothetical protein